MRADIGLIGGTGIGNRLEALPGVPVAVPTPFGVCRGKLIVARNLQVFAAKRHGTGHKVPPHAVNYRALAWGMRYLQVNACLSTAAVGSLLAELGPGNISVCGDFIDLTARNLTAFDGEVRHVSVVEALSPRVIQALVCAAKSKVGYEPNKVTYVGMNGPRYETVAEIRALSKLGGDVVGMTMTSEAIAMAEQGVPYGCIAIVSNFAAGMKGAVLDHEDVVEFVEKVGESVVGVLLDAAFELCK